MWDEWKGGEKEIWKGCEWYIGKAIGEEHKWEEEMACMYRNATVPVTTLYVNMKSKRKII